MIRAVDIAMPHANTSRWFRKRLGAWLLIAGLLAVAALHAAMAAGMAGEAELDSLSLSQLEARLQTIDLELDQLASTSLLNEVGTVGFRSQHHPDPQHLEWIEVDLEHEQAIDMIVLVPTIWRDAKNEFRADAFPLEFRILAGTRDDPNGKVLASYTESDHLLPRLAPLVVPCPGVSATWVRVEAAMLSPRAWDGAYILQLSEIMVFKGWRNVALRQPVRVSTDSRDMERPRVKEVLVDGFVPYLMDSNGGGQSIAFLSDIGIGDQPWIAVDLKRIHAVSQIQLHALELSDTVPRAFGPGLGMPRRCILEGATMADFSDKAPLCEFLVESVYDQGPIMIRNFPTTFCRYVRLTAVEPFIADHPLGKDTQIGFAEIEVIADGKNVAQGMEVRASFDNISPDRSLSSLTDGRNLYGRILSTRIWMEQLARRHDLETERPGIQAQIHQRHERQTIAVKYLGWLAAILAAGIIFTILVTRISRLRQVASIKERFAADLHDEVGANLHAIALLSDIARDKSGHDDDLVGMIGEIRTISLDTTVAARNCTSMLEAKGLCGDLSAEMKRTAKRLMVDLEHEIVFTGDEHLQFLRAQRRIDLLLFYKECLVNIIRHSHATAVKSHLSADRNRVSLIITDNGSGYDGGVPPSLHRRGRLAGGKVRMEKCGSGGTRISLILKTSRFRI